MTRSIERTNEVGFNGKTLSLKATYEKDDEQPYTHLLTLTAALDGVVVASSHSITVKKDYFRGGDFHEIMDIRSQETATFATTLFDGSGRLREEFVREGSARRGTGVWGHELDEGSLALIEDIHVHEPYRGQGYAKWILQQTLSQPEMQAPSLNFAYAWPCAVGQFSKEEHKAVSNTIDHIVALAGFRRVGRTEFVAYSLRDSNHPSRSLAAENDATILRDSDDEYDHLLTAEETNNLTPEEQELRKKALLASRFPLQYAIVNQNDDELMATFTKLLAEDPAAIRHRDLSGATPLHVAALKKKAKLIEKLLESEAKADVSATDRQGRTPLEFLEEQLTSEREFLRTFGIPFDGHSKESMDTKRLLLSAQGQLTPAELDTEQFGCTCGQCLFGYLSPRMRLRLTCCAEVAGDMIPDTLAIFSTQPRQPLDVYMVQGIHLTEYIPRSIRSKPVYASYIKGYGSCFSAMASLLKQGTLPTVEALRAELNQNRYDHRYMTHYFQHGGLLEHAMNALISGTREEADDEEHILIDEIDNLPTCANDNDYTMIHKKLGLTGQLVGPDLYGMMGGFGEDESNDSGSDMDEDDDENDVY